MHKPLVKLFIASSIDGFIARKNGSIDWVFTDQDYGFIAFYDSIDAIIMGRNTYEQILYMNEWPYEGKICYVFTDRIIDVRNDYIKPVSGNVTAIVPEIIAQTKGDVWLTGGSKLIASFRKSKLIDEYILSVHPLILGRGIPLFTDIVNEEKLRLINSQYYSNGLLQVRYVKNSEK